MLILPICTLTQMFPESIEKHIHPTYALYPFNEQWLPYNPLTNQKKTRKNFPPHNSKRETNIESCQIYSKNIWKQPNYFWNNKRRNTSVIECDEKSWCYNEFSYPLFILDIKQTFEFNEE